ncbi:MAG: sigma-70 family RNA polymerase sigma factor [Bacteroidota bacterium]|nr:sigma-70 family RNA polymerase sigma factor [Bacteroidota bacterium]MDP4234236.1 sigma-70 family RNA polymerase sigma factor [Bacteroidota bacterium]MDP4243426.1 sigma-70 family RNA polymerase sigma factor [Bacteroidota bacterium]MDP4288125.1 sigma-70 family RNA polymerase sigma factor [Bacteroidota bacterium]
MSHQPTTGGSGGFVQIDPLTIPASVLGFGPGIPLDVPVKPEPSSEKRRDAAETRQRRADAVDLALFEQVALERSEQAFSELYDRYAPRLYAMMLHYVRIEEDALDLMQDTFILLWEKAPLLYRENTHARAAIYHFARNCAIDAIRSRRRGKLRFEPLPEDQPTLDDLLRDERTPENNLNAKEARENLREALLTLNDSQRTAIDLAYFGGLTHAEIAARLKVAETTVDYAIYSAIRKLSKVLAPRFAEPVKRRKKVKRLPEDRLIKNEITITPYGNE